MRKRKINLKNPEFRKKIERAQKKWRKKLQPLIDASRASERITDKDMGIIINARAENFPLPQTKRRMKNRKPRQP